MDNRLLRVLAAPSVLVCLACGGGDAAPTPAPHAHAAGPGEPSAVSRPHEEAATTSNPVQAEMRALTAALAASVTAFGDADLTPIAHELHAVHAARERTAAAIEAGAYRPPAGADRMPRFLELDAAFHTELEQLAEAARAGERARAGAALGRALASCEGCHAEFRRGG